LQDLFDKKGIQRSYSNWIDKIWDLLLAPRAWRPPVNVNPRLLYCWIEGFVQVKVSVQSDGEGRFLETI